MKKPIQENPAYSVDENGFLYGKTGYALRPSINKNGYLYTAIDIQGKQRVVLIHQLVAHAFVSGYQDGYSVNHKDGNKCNNYADNLEWVSLADNTRHANDVLHAFSGCRNWNARAVRAIDKNNTSHVLSFSSLSDAVYAFGEEEMSSQRFQNIKTSIWRALKKERHSYKGFIWEYDDERTEKNRLMMKLVNLLTRYINYKSYIDQVELMNMLLRQQEEEAKQAKQARKRAIQIEKLQQREAQLAWLREHPEARKKHPPKMGTCKRCGKPITLNTPHDYCIECSHYFQRQTEWPSRDELKQMIRTMPFVRIASQYGVSDNAIRKWCKHYNLPFKSKEIKSYSDEEWEQI